MKTQFKNMLRTFSIAFAIIFTGCSEKTQSSSDNQPVPSTKLAKTDANQATQADSVHYLYDIPSLLRLSSKQIQSKLGHPTSNARESINEKVKTLRYKRRGYELSIDYVVDSGSIISIYFTNDNVKDYEKFIKLGNLTNYDSEPKPDTIKDEHGLCEGVSITLNTKSI